MTPYVLADVSAEHALSLADAPSLELRDRIGQAFRYTVSWSDAAGSAKDANGVPFADRIDAMQAQLRALYTAIPVDSVFPGKSAVAAYEATSANFAQLYRDLLGSADLLPQPSLLDIAAGLGKAVFDAPAAAITGLAETASNAIARALGGTAAAIWSALWPWLLVAGGAGVVYVFRAPLGRVVSKVAA